MLNPKLACTLQFLVDDSAVCVCVRTYFCCASSVSGVIPGCFPKKKLDHQWPESCLGSPAEAENEGISLQMYKANTAPTVQFI